MFLFFIIIMSILSSILIICSVVISVQSLLRMFGIKCIKHDYIGCTCRKCGMVRDTGHVYHRLYGKHETRNQPGYCKCGKICHHPIVKHCRCQVCGLPVHDFEIDDEWWSDSASMYKWRGHCKNCGMEDYA